MRVIFATGPVEEKGGTAKYALALAERFAAKGILCKTVPYTHLEVSLPIGIRHAVYFCRVFAALVGADVVLAFDTWSVGMPALLAAKLLRKPFVVRVGGDFLWEQYVERTGDLVKLSEVYDTRRNKFNLKERIIYKGTRFLLAHADVLACNSQWQIDLWRRAYGVLLTQATVIENVYPPHKAGVPPVKKNFVAAGRAMKLKQESMLVSVFAEVAREHPEVELDMQSLPPEQHQKRVEGCYAVVLASVSDVAPNVIIDAISYGKPFICTKDTGITERIGSLGIFVDTQDRNALKAAIVSLLKQEVYADQVKRISEFSFTRTFDSVADDFLGMIQKCVS